MQSLEENEEKLYINGLILGAMMNPTPANLSGSSPESRTRNV